MPSQFPVVNLKLAPTLLLVDRISISSILFSFVDRIHDLISQPWSLFHSPPKEKASPQGNSLESEATQHKNSSISKEEVKFVMEKLEFFCSEEEIEESWLGGEEIGAIFDESEPSLEELKQTFNVFDKNRDGCIDADELQSVLGLLVPNQGVFIHDCHRMIARFDHNKDGKIDFNEFVKFMEIALS
ncbi:putative calcium-binding protein CML45, partial [Cucurbita argyrosperma subsp. sororia]